MFRRPFLVILLLAVLTGSALVGAEEVPAVVVEPAYPVPAEIQAVLDIARAELGYTEERDGTTKYGTWVDDPKAEWCAEFLCWSVDQADKQLGTQLLKTQYPLYGANNTGRDWFLKQGRYVARTGFVPGWGSQWYTGHTETLPKNSYIPQPGDWVFFSYGSTGDTSHVAMVERVLQAPDGSMVAEVLEGNNPEAVARAHYKLDDWRIQGYGTVRDLADIVLRMGLEGEKVRRLQEKLAEVQLLAQDQVTGTYNQRTSDAVKAYQGIMGAKQTGIANQETQLSLEAYLVNWRTEQVGYFTVQDGE